MDMEKEIEGITSLDSELSVSGSKSLTARALVAASLAQGVSKIINASVCDDTQYLTDALAALGVNIRRCFDSQGSYTEVDGCDGKISTSQAALFVGNCGTAARFLTALCTLACGQFTIDVDERMRERPIRPLIDAFNLLGARVSTADRCFPVTVSGCGLRGGFVTVDCSQSSQFASAILLVAPYAKEEVTLQTHNAVSSPYIEMTVSVMNKFSVSVERPEPSTFTVKPTLYKGCDFSVEADLSSASYFFAAAAIIPGRVTVSNLSSDSPQADMRFLEILQQMGASVSARDSRVTVAGAGRLRGVDVDMRDTPDLVPTLCVIAPFADSPTTIRGIGHLRLKESDRIETLCEGLTQVGVKTERGSDWIRVFPGTVHASRIRTRGDHRIAMAFSILGLKVPGIVIDDCECVKKSFPDFFHVLSTL
jgi:3-phosphoshikimate 1-carboxyvinyltransferase